ncbi:MAG: hypothetical protein L6243_04015 [Candidatus Altiarchaeales archaeon]|nr:hypothetical protein [Candidatus Altiarchaeales archaeon]
MKRKGYVMTWDAILALIFIMLVFTGLITMEHTRSINVKEVGFLELHSTAEDSIEVLNKMGALEEIVIYWSENNTQLANDTATFYLEQFIPEKMGYRLTIGNDTICEDQRIMEAEAVEKTKSTRFMTGYGQEVNTSSDYITRAWLLYNDTDNNKTYSIADVGYGAEFKHMVGCQWRIEHITKTLTNENVTVRIPEGYPGSNECNYTGAAHSAPGMDDALNAAIYRIVNKSDTDNDGIMDLIGGMPFNETSMTFKTSNITTGTTTRMTEATLILWMK